MNIPVVMVCDENYILQTRVAIWTMRTNTADDHSLKIIILCSSRLPNDLRQQLLELNECHKNLHVDFCDVNDDLFVEAKAQGQIPIASFYRLIITEVMEEDKCLFLDGDLIVQLDLSSLFMEDVSDYYIAGVIDRGWNINPDKAKNHMLQYCFSSLDRYVNAGVMIYNLKKIREDQLQARFLQEIHGNYLYMDQDILNKVCYPKIKILPAYYNLFNRFLSCNDVKKTNIIHFAGRQKAWHNSRIKAARLWWHCAEQALRESDFACLYKFTNDRTNMSDWSYILERCRNENQIVIIGYSYMGVDVYLTLKHHNIKGKIIFCDNDPLKKQLLYHQHFDPSVFGVIRDYKNALFINASQRSYLEIYRQLIDCGVDANRIINYFFKDKDYFDSVDNRYISHEMRELSVKFGSGE